MVGVIPSSIRPTEYQMLALRISLFLDVYNFAIFILLLLSISDDLLSDGWKAGASGCAYTFATSNGIVTLTITAGSLIQVIEGQDLETATYVLSWSGTATGKIGSGTAAASPVTGAAVGGTNLNVEFGTGIKGKTRKGTTPTAWARRPIRDELSLCQRNTLVMPQYFRTRADHVQPNYVDFNVPIPEPMRATPSLESGTFQVSNLTDNTSISGFTFAAPATSLLGQ